MKVDKLVYSRLRRLGIIDKEINDYIPNKYRLDFWKELKWLSLYFNVRNEILMVKDKPLKITDFR